MYGKQLVALVGIASLSALLLSAPANAVTVSIGVSSGAIPGAALVSGSGATGTGGTFGTFTYTASAQGGSPPLSNNDLLLGQTVQTSTTAGGTFAIWVSGQGFTDPLSSALAILSTFTTNKLGSGTTVTLTTYLDSANGLFTGTQLSQQVFTGPISPGQTTALLGSADTGKGPYSLTEEFLFTSTGADSANLTIDMSATPIPAALPLFGGGLGVLGLLARRSKKKKLAKSALT